MISKPLPGARVTGSGFCKTGLVGAWLLNERSGVVANNSGSFGAVGNGVINNSANTNSHWVPSSRGSGFSADYNSSRYITISNFPYIRHVSIVAWIKTSNGGYQQIVNRDDAPARTWQFRVDVGGSFGFVPFNSSDVPATVTGTSVITDSKWHQVVGTWDGATVRCYIDGRQEGTPASLTGVLPLASTIIGFGQNTIFGGGGMVGFYDHVYIYNRALSAAEVRCLYANPFYPFQKRSLTSTFLFNAESLSYLNRTLLGVG